MERPKKRDCTKEKMRCRLPKLGTVCHIQSEDNRYQKMKKIEHENNDRTARKKCT